MIKNKFYEAPEAELLLVKFEETILSDGTWDNSITQGTTWGSDDENYGMY